MSRPQRSSTPTINDVAMRASVSISTVSRVMRGGTDVSTATRERVQQVVRELGYRPSSIARALVSGETRVIALLVSDLSNPFYPQLAKAVEREASKAGYAVVICNTEDDDDAAFRSLERLLMQGLDGVIYASGCGNEDKLLELLGEPRRLVFANRRPHIETCSYVVSDNREGSRELTRHLLELGHRHVGFVGGPSFATNATERLAGFHQALRDFPDATALVSTGPFAKDTGLQAVGAWLDHGFPLTAVIGVNDTVALGALEAILDRGRRVPEDLAVAGFDNVDLASSAILRLTTVAQDIEAMGTAAVQELLTQLRTADTFVPVHQILPTTLLTRRTTDLQITQK
jgi:LacI family transcriptional regulator